MCYCLLTIFSDSHRPVLKCPLFWDVFPLPSDINLHWLPIWELYKKELPPPRRVPLPPCKLFTCLPMILPIPPPLPLLLTWMPSPCLTELLLSLVFTPPSIPSIPLLECLTLSLLEINTIKSLEEFKNCSKTIRVYKILLPFLVWMNFPKKIN